MEKNIYPSTPICPSMPCPSIVTPRAFEKRDYWLLAGVALLGLLLDRAVYLGLSQLYGLFWLAYMGIAFAYLRPAFAAQRRHWFALVPAAVLCLNLFVYDSDEMALGMLVIPMLLMLHSCLLLPGSLKHIFIEFLYGWFVRPFVHLREFFRAISRPFTRGQGKTGKVLLGVAIALPMMIVMILLLSGADAVFASLGQKLLSSLSPELILHAAIIFACAMLFYSFLFSVRDGRRSSLPNEAVGARPFDPTVISTLLCCLLAVYAVFTFVQFAYLFGGAGLPDNLTYAEYAHRGFIELMAATALNGLLFFVVLRFTRSTALLRVLQALLVGATAVMVAAGLMRLLLYIGAYGFTMLRFNVLWFMIFLALCLVVAAIRLFRDRLNVPSVVALTFAACLVITQCMGAENLITRYNIARLEQAGALPYAALAEGAAQRYGGEEHPLDYLFTLSSDAVPALCDYYARSGDAVVRQHLEAEQTRLYTEFTQKPLHTISAEVAWQRLGQTLN